MFNEIREKEKITTQNKIKICHWRMFFYRHFKWLKIGFFFLNLNNITHDLIVAYELWLSPRC